MTPMRKKRRIILTAFFVNQEKKKTFHTCMESVKLWRSKSNLKISDLRKVLIKWGNKLIQETWKERNPRIETEAPHLNEHL